MTTIYTIDIPFAADPEDCGAVDNADMVKKWNAEFAPNCGAKIVGEEMGYPLVRVGSPSEDAVLDALTAYCSGDLEQALDLFEQVHAN